MFDSATTDGNTSVAVMTRGDFLERIENASEHMISDGFEIACQYIGATGYLLARENGMEDSVISSNWPYDLAKVFGNAISSEGIDAPQPSPSYLIFEPSFIEAVERFKVPDIYSRDICVLPITCGEQKYMIAFLFPNNSSHSQDRLRDAGLACSYYLAEFASFGGVENQHAELTEREMECLAWIARGKTSDEIALIIGISRNTVNNYITSIMNKTATKSRAEAVAEAVRGQLI
jgi:DNA-binding CsgD family transcriptional regulator